MKYASFWMRLATTIIDSVLLLIFFTLLALFVYTEFWLNYTGLFLVLRLVIAWLYFALFESSRKQGTIAQIILGLRVTDYQEQRISFWRASYRHFCKIFSIVILFYGYIMILFTNRRQALHDVIAKTLVFQD